ncbi:Ribosomal protein L24e-related like protein [Aduncisulcus paluster]|uniref:Ribosomal protein L24e-related like protein n=1 Tax=Aduncisulcus paluster TaxID=2918883 RepID=A0ABQ5K7P5_9EUKA|nr:Ribosomal protein L24e-related like protein [Aduncisulcus paluster]
MNPCSFCSKEYKTDKGIDYINSEGILYQFCTEKCQKLFLFYQKQSDLGPHAYLTGSTAATNDSIFEKSSEFITDLSDSKKDSNPLDISLIQKIDEIPLSLADIKYQKLITSTKARDSATPLGNILKEAKQVILEQEAKKRGMVITKEGKLEKKSWVFAGPEKPPSIMPTKSAYIDNSYVPEEIDLSSTKQDPSKCTFGARTPHQGGRHFVDDVNGVKMAGLFTEKSKKRHQSRSLLTSLNLHIDIKEGSRQSSPSLTGSKVQTPSGASGGDITVRKKVAIPKPSFSTYSAPYTHGIVMGQATGFEPGKYDLPNYYPYEKKPLSFDIGERKPSQPKKKRVETAPPLSYIIPRDLGDDYTMLSKGGGSRYSAKVWRKIAVAKAQQQQKVAAQLGASSNSPKFNSPGFSNSNRVGIAPMSPSLSALSSVTGPARKRVQFKQSPGSRITSVGTHQSGSQRRIRVKGSPFDQAKPKPRIARHGGMMKGGVSSNDSPLVKAGKFTPQKKRNIVSRFSQPIPRSSSVMAARRKISFGDVIDSSEPGSPFNRSKTSLGFREKSSMMDADMMADDTLSVGTSSVSQDESISISPRATDEKDIMRTAFNPMSASFSASSTTGIQPIKYCHYSEFTDPSELDKKAHPRAVSSVGFSKQVPSGCSGRLAASTPFAERTVRSTPVNLVSLPAAFSNTPKYTEQTQSAASARRAQQTFSTPTAGRMSRSAVSPGYSARTPMHGTSGYPASPFSSSMLGTPRKLSEKELLFKRSKLVSRFMRTQNPSDSLHPADVHFAKQSFSIIDKQRGQIEKQLTDKFKMVNSIQKLVNGNGTNTLSFSDVYHLKQKMQKERELKQKAALMSPKDSIMVRKRVAGFDFSRSRETGRLPRKDKNILQRSKIMK